MERGDAGGGRARRVDGRRRDVERHARRSRARRRREWRRSSGHDCHRRSRQWCAAPAVAADASRGRRRRCGPMTLQPYASNASSYARQPTRNLLKIRRPHDDPTTLGRARLSFANEADIDEFVDMLEQVRARRDHAGSMARVPPRARHLRPAADRRRADAARQDSAGHPRRATSSRRWPTSPSATRAASATSPRGRTSSSTSSSCTTSSRRCAGSPTPA